jgi:DNA repair photolyase
MSSPHARLDAIRPLRAAKVPVGVMVAPIIPGPTDREIPKILDTSAEPCAQFRVTRLFAFRAWWPPFDGWLERHAAQFW